MAPLIKGVPKLTHSGDCFETIGLEWVETEIHATDVGRFRIIFAGSFNLAAPQAIGDIDPMVRSEKRMAHSQLRILDGKALEEDFSFVGLAAAGVIAEIDDVRR